MSTDSNPAVAAIQDNLHLIFEEADATKRRAAIEQLWANSEDAVFVDPERIWRGHDEIDQCITSLVEKFKGWVFVEIGDAQLLPEKGPDGGMQVVRQAWGYGPPGEEPKVKGQDVATLVEGKIQMLVAILE
ncbi:uncharacterized protein LTR77_004450 [Saxophila tyrrhenica]|uniref:SnoaL-like domain-containing protein n=1 Tax=Saxophila tyrrhenica TaxID=1690608 RepID=A0AAV9PDM7_9PEZI|nr:hypothetical protein LTR77_004450 [Saxophila tyrrhenica]